MAFSTYEAFVVVDPVTGRPVRAAAGKVTNPDTGAAIDLFDMNDVPISILTTNAQGYCIGFKTSSGIRSVLVEFGAVIMRKIALEVNLAAESVAAAAAAAEAEARRIAEELTDRVEGVEALAGLSPSSPTDGQTSNLINQPDTLTRSAVEAVVHGQIESNDYWTTLESHGAVGDGVANDYQAFAAAIDDVIAHGGGVVKGAPGTNYGFSGRVRIKSGATLDFGKPGENSRTVPLTATSGFELEAGAGFFGTVAPNIAYTGPALEINDTKKGIGYGRGHRQATYDLFILGKSTPGSVGLLLDSSTNTGVAWTKGRVVSDSMDDSVILRASGSGYVNENVIDMTSYNAVNMLQMLCVDVAGAVGAVDMNKIVFVGQTSALPRLKKVLYCEGRFNTISMTAWDVLDYSLHPDADGVVIEFSANSRQNELTGTGPYSVGSLYRQAVADKSSVIYPNVIRLNSARHRTMSQEHIKPVSFRNTYSGDQHDALAFASDGRYPVTVTGDYATAGALSRLFTPGEAVLEYTGVTSLTITVDLGSDYSSTAMKVTGVTLQEGFLPDELYVEVSLDSVTWQKVIEAGTSGAPMSADLVRSDNVGLGALRYIRIRAVNNTPKAVRLFRWYLFGEGYGAWLPRFAPDITGELKINGTKVLGPRNTGWAALTGEQTKATFDTETVTLVHLARHYSALIAILKEHGLIG